MGAGWGHKTRVQIFCGSKESYLEMNLIFLLWRYRRGNGTENFINSALMKNSPSSIPYDIAIKKRIIRLISYLIIIWIFENSEFR